MAKCDHAGSVRERVQQGKNVRPGPLADAAGVARATVHAWINDGKLEAIRFERTVMIPAHAAGRLLGMAA